MKKELITFLLMCVLIVGATIAAYIQGQQSAVQCHADCASQLNELGRACERDEAECKGFVAEVTKAREECRTELLDCQQVVQTAYIEKATEIKDNQKD